MTKNYFINNNAKEIKQILQNKGLSRKEAELLTYNFNEYKKIDINN